MKTNLRYRTNFQVIEDVNPPKNNTSGYKGVSWDASRKKWTAYISVHNKRIFIGRYSSLDDAVEARRDAEEKYHQPLIDQKKTIRGSKHDRKNIFVTRFLNTAERKNTASYLSGRKGERDNGYDRTYG